MKEKMYDRS